MLCVQVLLFKIGSVFSLFFKCVFFRVTLRYIVLCLHFCQLMHNTTALYTNCCYCTGLTLLSQQCSFIGIRPEQTGGEVTCQERRSREIQMAEISIFHGLYE